jgi:hypothetical protein
LSSSVVLYWEDGDGRRVRGIEGIAEPLDPAVLHAPALPVGEVRVHGVAELAQLRPVDQLAGHAAEQLTGGVEVVLDPYLKLFQGQEIDHSLTVSHGPSPFLSPLFDWSLMHSSW